MARGKTNGRSGSRNGGGSHFEQAFRGIDDVLRQEAAQTTELDYTEQTSWLLFLKYLDDLEEGRRMEAELRGEAYAPILDEAHRWGAWATDLDLTGPDLIAFVNEDLWPYLRGFKDRASGPRTLEYKIGESSASSGPSFSRATRCATRLSVSTSFASAARRSGTSSARCTKTRSSAWATPDATAANITRRAH